jgi:hypothetical protein
VMVACPTAAEHHPSIGFAASVAAEFVVELHFARHSPCTGKISQSCAYAQC